MSDIAITFDGKTLSADYGLAGTDLALDHGLTSAIVNSLMICARARPDDFLPEDPRVPGAAAPERVRGPLAARDRRGWVGDIVPPREAAALGRPHVTGSRLWLLEREKITAETLRRAEDFAREGLQCLIDYGVARSFEITASHPRPGVLALNIVAEQPDGTARRYELAWRTHAV